MNMSVSPEASDACARPEHRRPYTLWSQAGALAGKGRLGAATKKPPHSLTPSLAELQVGKEKGWGATLPLMEGVGAKKKRAEWANARKP